MALGLELRRALDLGRRGGPLILILELVGTLAFAASGAMTALKKGMDLFGVCILGLTTAVGGGVIRDVLADTMPFILRKHIYAVASLAGAFVCQRLIGQNLYLALAAGTAVVLVIRILASHYRWNLPRPLHGEK